MPYCGTTWKITLAFGVSGVRPCEGYSPLPGNRPRGRGPAGARGRGTTSTKRDSDGTGKLEAFLLRYQHAALSLRQPRVRQKGRGSRASRGGGRGGSRMLEHAGLTRVLRQRDPEVGLSAAPRGGWGEGPGFLQFAPGANRCLLDPGDRSEESEDVVLFLGGPDRRGCAQGGSRPVAHRGHATRTAHRRHAR